MARQMVDTARRIVDSYLSSCLPKRLANCLLTQHASHAEAKARYQTPRPSVFQPVTMIDRPVVVGVRLRHRNSIT